MIGSSLVTAARNLFRRSAEGAVRPGPWFLGKTGGWLDATEGSYLNFWQMGFGVQPTGRSAIVQACISAYAQTVSMCPGDHWRATDAGGRERVDKSAATRILRRPNAYQSASDFLQNLVWQLYESGNGLALGLRNDRFEVEELHLMSSAMSRPVLSEDGELFYHLGGNELIARRLGVNALVVPSRDVLHVRLNAPQGRTPWPLWGETPLASIAGELTTQNAIGASQSNFYLNQARPSAVLSTDLVLDRSQVEDLRQKWEEQSRGLKTGGTPILTAGLKVQPWAGTFRDAQTAEILKLSDERVALAFRIPMQILGMGGGSPAGSTEVLMQSWVSSGLGYALNIVEEAMGQFFRLRGGRDEYIEFDTEALLRSQFKDRIDALVKGVQGGVYSPNDARNMESLDSVPYGDDVRVQAQNVPLSAASAIPSAPASPAAPAAPVKALTRDLPALEQARAELAAYRRRLH